MDELISLIIDICKIVRVTGIGQCIEVNQAFHIILGQHLPGSVASNKSAPSSQQDSQYNTSHCLWNDVIEPVALIIQSQLSLTLGLQRIPGQRGLYAAIFVHSQQYCSQFQIIVHQDHMVRQNCWQG